MLRAGSLSHTPAAICSYFLAMRGASPLSHAGGHARRARKVKASDWRN